MSEEHTNEHREPFLGKLGATVTATVCGGVLVFALSAVVTAPQNADVEIKQSISELRAQVDELRATYQEHRANAGADIKELSIQVESGTNDRYTSKDAERDHARIEALDAERESALRRDISRIENQMGGIIKYMTEERRFQEKN